MYMYIYAEGTEPNPIQLDRDAAATSDSAGEKSR